MNFKFKSTYIDNFKVNLKGSKNISLPIICASLLSSSSVTLHNVPNISDVTNLLKLLNKLHIYYTFNNNTLHISKPNLQYHNLYFDEFKSFRASYYIWPILLVKYNYFETYYPGGCTFQNRPIDEHIRLFNALGYKFILEKDKIIASKYKQVTNLNYTFNISSVGATINALLYLVTSNTQATLYNYNKDPEVIEVIKFLKICGCHIIRNNSSLVIKPINKLSKINYVISSCRIEQISYASLVLYPKVKKVTLINPDIRYIKLYLSLLKTLNINIIHKHNKLILSKSSCFNYNYNLNDVITFGSYPLLSTDCQAIVITSLLNFNLPIKFIDLIYSNRTTLLKQLSNIGVKYYSTSFYTIYEKSFYNAPLYSCDLRCGFALFSLIFFNEFKEIDLYDCHYILRGYNSFLDILKRNGISYEAI